MSATAAPTPVPTRAPDYAALACTVCEGADTLPEIAKVTTLLLNGQITSMQDFVLIFDHYPETLKTMLYEHDIPLVARARIHGFLVDEACSKPAPAPVRVSDYVPCAEAMRPFAKFKHLTVPAWKAKNNAGPYWLDAEASLQHGVRCAMTERNNGVLAVLAFFAARCRGYDCPRREVLTVDAVERAGVTLWE